MELRFAGVPRRRRADSAEPNDTEPKIKMMPQTATIITVRSRLEIFSVARSGADA